MHWASHLAKSYIQHSLCNVLNKHHPAFISKIINVNNQWDCFKGNTTVRYAWTLTINPCSHFIMLAFAYFFLKQICVWHGSDYTLYQRATDKRIERGSIYLPREINKRGSRGSGEINIAIDHLRCIFNHCPWQITVLFGKKVGVSTDQWLCRLNLMARWVENNGCLMVLVHLSQQSTAPLAWIFVCIECVCCRGDFYYESNCPQKIIKNHQRCVTINKQILCSGNTGKTSGGKEKVIFVSNQFLHLMHFDLSHSLAHALHLQRARLVAEKIKVTMNCCVFTSQPLLCKDTNILSHLFRMWRLQWGYQVKRFSSSALDRKLCLALSLKKHISVQIQDYRCRMRRGLDMGQKGWMCSVH